MQLDDAVGKSAEQVLIDWSRPPGEEAAAQIERIGALLSKRLGPEYLSHRQGGGGNKLTYIEGWRIINLANEVFGFNGWSSEVRKLEVDFMDYNEESGRFCGAASATVRIILTDGTFHEDVGCGKMENSKSKADLMDKIKKEAVTDGLKRAMRTFGSLLGNCLYDKQFVEDIAKIKPPPRPKLDFGSLHRPGQMPTANSVPQRPAQPPPVAGPSKPVQPSRPAPPVKPPQRMQAPARPLPATKPTAVTAAKAANNPPVQQNAPQKPKAPIQGLTQQASAADSASDYWEGEGGSEILEEDIEGPDAEIDESGIVPEQEDSGFVDMDTSVSMPAKPRAPYPNAPNPNVSRGAPGPAPINRLAPHGRGPQTGGAGPSHALRQPLQQRAAGGPPQRQNSVKRSVSPIKAMPVTRPSSQQSIAAFGGDGFGQPPADGVPTNVSFTNARGIKRMLEEETEGDGDYGHPEQDDAGLGVSMVPVKGISPVEQARRLQEQQAAAQIARNKAAAQAKRAKTMQNSGGNGNAQYE